MIKQIVTLTLKIFPTLCYFILNLQLGNFASSVPNNPVCMLDNQLGGSGDPYNTKTLIYRYNQALGNIMERLTWVSTRATF